MKNMSIYEAAEEWVKRNSVSITSEELLAYIAKRNKPVKLDPGFASQINQAGPSPLKPAEPLERIQLKLQAEQAEFKRLIAEKDKSYQNLIDKHQAEIEQLKKDKDNFEQRYIIANAKQAIRIQELEEQLKQK